jgi:sec-independent protein translocase protein TatA
MTFGGPEAIILLILVLVLFGGSQIPKLARNLGKAQKEFKDGIADANKPADADPPAVDAANTTSTTKSDDA